MAKFIIQQLVNFIAMKNFLINRILTIFVLFIGNFDRDSVIALGVLCPLHTNC